LYLFCEHFVLLALSAVLEESEWNVAFGFGAFARDSRVSAREHLVTSSSQHEQQVFGHRRLQKQVPDKQILCGIRNCICHSQLGIQMKTQKAVANKMGTIHKQLVGLEISLVSHNSFLVVKNLKLDRNLEGISSFELGVDFGFVGFVGFGVVNDSVRSGSR